jgi:low temperature requirement protein LtrA
LALVGLMFASLLMSVAIDDAFGDRAWLFVTGYLLLQVGRCLFLIAALRGRPQGEHFVNDLVLELLSGALGLAALAILAVATAPLSLIAGIAASSAVLIAMAIADTVETSVHAPSRSA